LRKAVNVVKGQVPDSFAEIALATAIMITPRFGEETLIPETPTSRGPQVWVAGLDYTISKMIRIIGK
jgi:hypothetical protein